MGIRPLFRLIGTLFLTAAITGSVAAQTRNLVTWNPCTFVTTDYRTNLRDLELQAAKRGAGAWAKTKWDLLPSEREAEREENDELAIASGTAKLTTGSKADMDARLNHWTGLPFHLRRPSLCCHAFSLPETRTCKSL